MRRASTAYNTPNNDAHQMKSIAAPLFLPRLGIVRSAAGNESFMSGVAHSFTSGKNNGVVGRNVMCKRAN